MSRRRQPARTVKLADTRPLRPGEGGVLGRADSSGVLWCCPDCGSSVSLLFRTGPKGGRPIWRCEDCAPA